MEVHALLLELGVAAPDDLAEHGLDRLHQPAPASRSALATPRYGGHTGPARRGDVKSETKITTVT